MSGRVVVIGLDGLPHSVLQRLAKEGVMPEMAKLLRHGDLAAMDTVYPPLSSVSWTTFFTGVNPGRHRIFGFMEPQIDDYGIWFQNLNDVKAPTLWEHAQAHGKRTVCVNLPGTFPAPPLNGVMVSGFIADDLAKATYPKVLLPLLEKVGYMLDLPCESPAELPDRFWEECHRSLVARERLVSALLEHEPFELLISVVTETDRTQHFFFDALEDPWHPQRAACYAFYRTVDALVGRWVSLCRPEDHVIILADHGFCRIQQDVYLNHWLKEKGYLVMKKPDSGVPLMEIDAEKTRAFALDPGRIFINMRGRQPSGCVDPAGAPALIDEIASALKELTIKVPWSAQPFHPIKHIFRREEIYNGPWTFLAADLVLHNVDGYEFKGKFNHPVISDIGALTGMHTFGDAMLYIRNGKWNTVNPRMIDLAPTILHLLGIPKPDTMEGRILVD